MSNPKIIDIISNVREDGKPHISLEYFPPRSEVGTKVRDCNIQQLACFATLECVLTHLICLNHE